MSLHTVAKHMAAQGRGPDDQLVHMSKREVAGLQALAMAHGGSLTINPQTGLVEAGFLDRLMPTLIGAGLMYATGGLGAGALTAGEIGLGVGGLQTALTGNIMEGLKAGLGAYGGAGLMGGFMPTTGAGGAAPSAAPSVPAATTPAPVATGPVTPTGVGADVNGLTADTGMTTTGMPQNTALNYQSGLDIGGPGSSPANMGAAPTQAVTRAPAGGSGIGSLTNKEAMKYGAAALGSMADTSPKPILGPEKYTGPLSKYRMSEDYKAYEPQQPNPYYTGQRYAYGMAGGGVVEQMSNANAIGQNTGYPQADLHQGAYATPWQTPISRNVVSDAGDAGVDSFTGEPRGMASGGLAGTFENLLAKLGVQDSQSQALHLSKDYQPYDPNVARGYAGGGITSLGSYSDGGRMLKGPGDGMSDNIPAQIGGKQPARLADGEFVVPADVVSHLGNGSSDAGARQLYKMMDRIRQQRTGKKKQAPEVNPSKAMPA